MVMYFQDCCAFEPHAPQLDDWISSRINSQMATTAQNYCHLIQDCHNILLELP